MAVIHTKVIFGRRYVDAVDLEVFLRRVQHNNPNITVEQYVKHIIKEVCEK